MYVAELQRRVVRLPRERLELLRSDVVACGAAARRCLSPAMISLAQSEPGARPDWGAAVDAPPLRWTDEWLHEVAATTLTTLLGH